MWKIKIKEDRKRFQGTWNDIFYQIIDLENSQNTRINAKKIYTH